MGQVIGNNRIADGDNTDNRIIQSVSFVIPENVNLNVEQRQILASTGQRQGVPFTMSLSGTLSEEVGLQNLKKIRTVISLLTITTMSMNISDDDLLRFHYSSTSTIEANIYFFVLDSTSREKLK
mmetsp:Transcript_2982/g.4181  ORF Transcript_2982/g.4181 Transcript_2982/m.4181 type:complete len:124 (+) Transcript_2982:63-434(+)